MINAGKPAPTSRQAGRELILLTRLIQRIPPKNPAALERRMVTVVNGMTEEQRLAFSDPAVRERDSRLACTAFLRFFSGLNALEPEDREVAMRQLYLNQ